MTRMERDELKRLWKEGTIGIPVENNKTVIAHYIAKVYDEPSEYGINEGRISKLQIKIDGVAVAEYDRGWDLEPEESNQAAQVALAIILNDWN